MTTETKTETRKEVSPQIKAETMCAAYAVKVGGDPTTQRLLGLIAEHAKRSEKATNLEEFVPWLVAQYESLVTEQEAIGNIDRNLHLGFDTMELLCQRRFSLRACDACSHFEGKTSGRKDAKAASNTIKDNPGKTVRQLVLRANEMKKTQV